MIRPYLGYVEMMEMISRRLTKDQKSEILNAYMAGESTKALAEKYSCTGNTINRTVKTLLSESEYLLLKETRLKGNNKKGKFVNKEYVKVKDEDLQNSNSLISLKDKEKVEDRILKANEDFYISEVDALDSLAFEKASNSQEDLPFESQNNKKIDVDKQKNDFDNNFEVIAPLVSDFDFDQEKKKSDFEILNYESLPESVYMIVDKKVELDLQTISDLPEWWFLPESELERNAIILFPNQRSAKRSCSRNQRVIKIPNTSIFEISKSYLIAKGITRLILEDSIIAVDN